MTALGAVFHAHAVFLGLVVKAQSQSPDGTQGFAILIAQLVSYRIVLIGTLFTGLMLFALWYAFVVACKKTAYPLFSLVS